MVEQLRREFPHLTLVINGGIRSLEYTKQCLSVFDGVMLGREICENPYRLAELHRDLYAPHWQPAREAVIERYIEYIERRLSEGHRLASMLRHVLPLYSGQPRARSWRRFISERATLATTTPNILRDSLRIVGEPTAEMRST
jgi:tRNA-dihydrouridine synthase A